MAFMERRWRPRRPLTTDQLLGIANYLTYARIALVPIVVLIMMGLNDNTPRSLTWNKLLSWGAMLSFEIAQISDVVDGYYARKFGVISSFGKFLDPLADKLLSMSALIMLVPLHRIAAWIVVLLIARETIVTALRGMAASEGIEIAASDWGKKKTLIQSFAIGALLLHYPLWEIHVRLVGIVLLWLTVVISVGSGIHYVFTFFEEVLESQKTETKI